MSKLEEDYSRLIADEKPPVEEAQIEEDKPRIVESKPQLWVDKYSAKNYFDMLTDECINRNVLQWLKSWDEIVVPERFKPIKQ